MNALQCEWDAIILNRAQLQAWHDRREIESSFQATVKSDHIQKDLWPKHENDLLICQQVITIADYYLWNCE